MIKNINGAYINDVLDVITNLDDVQDISRDELITYHAQIGYWLAIANGDYEKAREERVYAESDAMLAAKLADPKMTQALVEATGSKAAKPLKDAEIKAKTQAQKLEHLYDTLGKALHEG